MLQKVIVGVVLLISLSFNVHITVRDYLIEKEREFYSNYLDYTVVSDRNGQIMGLLQLQTVACLLRTARSPMKIFLLFLNNETSPSI